MHDTEFKKKVLIGYKLNDLLLFQIKNFFSYFRCRSYSDYGAHQWDVHDDEIRRAARPTDGVQGQKAQNHQRDSCWNQGRPLNKSFFISNNLICQ